MKSGPLVSVICLCHNQSRFVKEAVESVWNQSYENIELIIVDDGSTDDSKSAIASLIKDKHIQFIDIATSIGNCRAFNKGFRESKGGFIIDLAADDVLLPERIARGFEAFNDDVGVVFSDAEMIAENGDFIKFHHKRNESNLLDEEIPTGDVYRELIHRYFISPPTMMIRREVLEELNGYDESLSYEDFDFWVRSSRKWKYNFQDEILVKKRVVKNSLSNRQFQWLTKHQKSTLRVCRKIKTLNRSIEEQRALRKRCFYEIRQCLRQGNLLLIPAFLKLAI